MRFHLPSLPHTQLTKDYSWCAYTEKVRKWSNMMTSLGHEVFVYGGERNEADCTEHVTSLEEYEQEILFEEKIPPFHADSHGFKMFAARTIRAIQERSEPDDFLCLIGGLAQKPIADALPAMTCVEFGVGYEGVFSRFRVFESYAWMHMIYGQQGPHAADGKFYDAVIPNSFEAEDFPLGEGLGDYLLFVGRLTARKGLQVVADVAKRTGLPLVVAGEGDTSLVPEGAEYVGLVGPSQRAKIMGEARALICPTLYIEPFGGVAVEAQLCGTPVLTTDWGAFPETVEQGVTGFRCRTLAEFCDSVTDVGYLSRAYIRRRAMALYSTDTVKYQYQDYFQRLEGLKGEGWYA